MFNHSVKEYGAVGDGFVLDTAAIQKAIDDCAAVGGTVRIEDGTYLTGTLFLKSNVTLRLETTGKLLASTNGVDYPNFEPKTWDAYQAPRHSSRCLIYAENAENITVCGNGIIDCQGEYFCKPNDRDRFWSRTTNQIPARMIFFYGCRNIKIENITMREMAGGWGFWINNCDFVSFDFVKVLCNPLYPNSDGIHINCSSDVSISNCTVNCGDDAIIVRANTNTLSQKRSCERVTVTGCHLSSQSNAIRIGWTNDGKIQNCTFSNCTVTDSWRGISIEFPKKSKEPFADQGDDDTEVRNLIFDSIVMDRITEMPLQILVYPYNKVKEIKNIRFSNITADCGMYPVFLGRETASVHDITLADCCFTLHADGEEPHPMLVKQIQNLQLKDVILTESGK